MTTTAIPRFQNLKHAFAYCEKCPICKESMSVNHVSSIVHDYSVSDFNDKINILVGFNNVYQMNTPNLKLERLYISMDVNSDKISSLAYKEELACAIDYNVSNDDKSLVSVGRKLSDDIVMFNIMVECFHCFQYSFSISAYISQQHLMLLSCELESERITLDDGSVTYEINNIYDQKSTVLIKTDDLENYITLPLIPISLTNPYLTLRRAKNIVPFS